MGKGQEGGTDGWEGGIDVMPLMKWVHRHSMAWKGCRIGFVFPACESHGSRRPN